jgi:hypothetical protein
MYVCRMFETFLATVWVYFAIFRLDAFYAQFLLCQKNARIFTHLSDSGRTHFACGDTGVINRQGVAETSLKREGGHLRVVALRPAVRSGNSHLLRVLTLSSRTTGARGGLLLLRLAGVRKRHQRCIRGRSGPLRKHKSSVDRIS